MTVAPLLVFLRRIRRAALLLPLACSLLGCGGGANNIVQNPPPPAGPDFRLGVSPLSVSMAGGGSSSASLSAMAENGFSAAITVQVTGLPAGVSVSPPNITLTPGNPQPITLTAAVGAAPASATAIFTGTSGALRHTANLGVAVTKGVAPVFSSRTAYMRTDAVTEYYRLLNTHWTVFSPATNRFFVADPLSNKIFVFDAASEKEIGSIAVPGAFGIDDTTDHSLLYAGTLIGDVYAIDPMRMQVTRRYLASEIGPYGYQAYSALVLSDGRLALLGAQGGFPSVDGSTSIAIWNPADNSITYYGAPPASGVSAQPLCPMGNLGGFARSGDRTMVFVGSVDSDGTLCQINPATGQHLSAAVGGFSTIKVVTSPDGRYVALPIYPDQVVLYDAHNLNQLAVFSVAGDTSSAADLFFSADSSILFVPDVSILYAYSVATHQQVGWMPNIVVQFTSGGYAVGPAASPIFEAGDGTGLICGPLEEGFGCLDTTQLQTGPVGTQFTNAYLNPATGPAAGGTVVAWEVPSTVNGPTAVYFGSSLASSISAVNGALSVTSPPGVPGAVNVTVLSGDGGMQIIADGFSYGPTVLQVSPDSSSAEGGGIGVIYGYGFGPVTATTIPPGLTVTVGGQPATILAFNPNAYGLSAPPFLLQSLYYTIPAGSAGSSADIAVTTSSGSATAHQGLTYLPSVQRFPLPGSVLVQGIYDPLRDVYYFTDASRIQVFSLTQGRWLSPINIPAPAGKSQRLWGISLSPDGSKLAVADALANVIYVVDAANSSSVQTFPFAPPSPPQGVIEHPIGVAISDSGILYITVFVEGGSGFRSFFKLDTNTGNLTAYDVQGPQYYVDGMPQDVYLKTTISSDNTRVFFNDDGYVFSVDTASDTIFSASADQGCCYGDFDLTNSVNQTQIEATSYLYDTDLNARSFLTLNDREVLDISYVYGTKLSPDGSLLFQPSTNGIDVYDGRVGTLRSRIALPFALSLNYDALVGDGHDNLLLAITGTSGNGIAVLDLTSVAEPPPLSYAASRSADSLNRARNFDRSISSRGSAQPGGRSSAPVSRPRLVPHLTNSILLHR